MTPLSRLRSSLVLQRYGARSARGVVLPIVLVILVVLTGLVVTQIRRSTVDERLAANAREYSLMDNAAQTVLRWCELRMVNFPRTTATFDSAAALPPLWRVQANWNDARSFDFTGTNIAGISATGNDAPRCIIEEATCELSPPISPTGQGSDACNGLDPRWRKFRITARVVTAQDVPGLRRAHFAQSELRTFID
jgi:hypothetical protein